MDRASVGQVAWVPHEDLVHLALHNSNKQWMPLHTGPFYTRAWGPLTRDIQIMWLVEKLETVQVHFTPYLLGMKIEGIRMDEIFTWRLIANKWTMCHNIPNISLGPYKRDGSNANQGHGKQLNCHWLWEIIRLSSWGSYTTFCFGVFIKYVAIPQHGPLSLYTILRVH